MRGLLPKVMTPQTSGCLWGTLREGGFDLFLFALALPLVS